MGLVNGALQIGRSALLAYQSALQVLGNNISNAGTESYTRQTPVLSPYQGVALPEGLMPGGGVTLTALRRNVDASLDSRLRAAMGDQADATAQQKTLSRIETVLNELSDADLSSLMQKFFNAFSSLANAPQDLAARGMVLIAGDSLAREVQRQRADVYALRDEMNVQLESVTKQADKLASQIAGLNSQIVGIESPGSGMASGLRDQRDTLLRELGGILQVQTREQPDGSINVYVGNELFIAGGMSRGLTTTLDTNQNEPKAVVRFADNNRQVTLLGGQMAGLVAARDTHVADQVKALDNFARSLMAEVNKVHAGGHGLTGYQQLTGAFDVQDPNAALTSTEADLPLTPQNGSFILYVTSTKSSPPSQVATTVEVDLDGIGQDETLATLAAKLDAVDHVQASVTADHRLHVTADEGFEMTFGEDSSNALAALGMNVFFTGTSAQDLSVNPDLQGDAALVAAATEPAEGDGSNAGKLAALATQALSSLNGQNLTGLYNAMASNVAVKSSAAKSGVDAADTIVQALTAQRESISGVSLDEETISMLRFERAFGAAARYMTVVDQMVQEMLNIVR